MAPLSAGRGRSTLPRTRLMGNSGSHQPQSASAFQFPLFSPCCTSLLARLEFPVQEILRPQPGHVPESNCHRGVCPAREQSGVANEIQNDWIGGLMFALGASLSIVPGVAREKNPERKCLFRGNHPPSYQMHGSSATASQGRTMHTSSQIVEFMGCNARMRFTCVGS